MNPTLATRRQIALIDETRCIGCFKCVRACPEQAIVGAARWMHTILHALCTGCENCLPPVQKTALPFCLPPRSMTPAQRQQLFERLAQANPHPTTELIWHTPFQLLLAVLLSAQSTDVGVNRVTAPLFPTLQTPQDLLTLGLATFEEAIRTLGLYRTKSRHAIEMAKILVDQHEGQVPETQVELEALPGVGRKTANVVLNTLYGHPTIAVDTHVFRVANRTGLARGTTPLAVEQALLRAVPAPFLQHAHHWLILQGRHICLARAPRCGICPIQDLCDTGKIHV